MIAPSKFFTTIQPERLYGKRVNVKDGVTFHTIFYEMQRLLKWMMD